MVLSRSQWGAEYDASIRPPMSLPAPDLWVHHTVTNPSSNPAADMRAIERIDIGRFGYPSYSWVVHPSGVVLEGMGTHIGAHTYHHNSTSFGVSFIGNFENDTPTPAALDAFVALCRDLIARNWLRPGAPTGGHRDVYPTACPGAHLYPLIPSLRTRVAQPSTPSQPAPPPRRFKVNAVASDPVSGETQIAELRDDGLVWLRNIRKGAAWYNTPAVPDGKPLSMDAGYRKDGTLDVSVRTDKGVTWIIGAPPGGPFAGWYVP